MLKKIRRWLKPLPGMVRTPSIVGHEPPMQIEEVLEPDRIAILLAHIQETWNYLGEMEPHWSVISQDKFKKNRMDSNIDHFYETGRSDLDRLIGTLARNGIDISGYKSCIEYGCGVGRVTRWMATQFQKVYGCDISRTHLASARGYLEMKNIENVEFVHISSVADIKALANVDVIFSYIVLQHNPPPVIKIILQNLLAKLNPNGVACFQVPTYREGYQFSFHEYLAGEMATNMIEMHVLPQKEIFAIIRECGCRVIEVLEDDKAGMRAKEISNSFLVQACQ